MPRKRLSMRKIRDVLRLKYGLSRSHRETAAILRISHNTVGSYVQRAAGSGSVLAAAGRVGRRESGGGAVSADAAIGGAAAGAGLGAGTRSSSSGSPEPGSSSSTTGGSLPSRARDDTISWKSSDDRYARRGTLLASQIPVEHWHEVVGDPAFGGPLLDLPLNNAHRLVLKGGSMRKLYDSTKTASTS